MRATLISWLIEVHMKFRLRTETLYIAVSILDRFCEKQEVRKDDFQLIGVTALFIAAKYEEVSLQKIMDYVNITAMAYSRREILDCEYQILKHLDFEVGVPTVYRFLERYHSMSGGKRKVFRLACYISELCMLEATMNWWKPSRIASSCLYVARKLLKER